jgi:hypothetical protein
MHVILRPEFTSPDAGMAKTHHHIHVFLFGEVFPVKRFMAKRCLRIASFRRVSDKMLH